MLQNQIACLYWLASIAQLHSQSGLSDEYLKQGLRLAGAADDTYWKAELLRCQANLHILRSEFPLADRSLGEALVCYRRVGHLLGMATLRRTRAKLLDQSNRSFDSINELHWAARYLQSRDCPREFYETLVALCFWLIDDREISKAMALMIEFINASNSTQYAEIRHRYEQLARHEFVSAPALDKITDFVCVALHGLEATLSDPDRLADIKVKNVLKVKYQFVAYFLSDYRYKLAGVQLHGRWDGDLTGFDDFMTPHCALSLNEIIGKLSRNILTRRNALLLVDEIDERSEAGGKEVTADLGLAR